MIEYRENQPLEPVEVARVFEASGITRPTKDIPRIAQMFANANVVISAWDGTRLIGVSRALTDYSYCCYLSDLAVDVAYQKRGIGRELIRRTQSIIGEEVYCGRKARTRTLSTRTGTLSMPVRTTTAVGRRQD